MAKKATYVSNDTRVKEIIKVIECIGYKHGISRVFDDYLTIASCAISNAVDKVHFDEREALYMETIKRYSKEELQQFAELHAMVINALERSLYSKDLLGELYHGLNLHNEHNGQFFTPMHICSMMAKMVLGNVKKQIESKGHIFLSEPTCGSGAMVIAGAGVVLEQKCNPSADMCVYAVDNDRRCAMMAYIQLSMLGIPAVVVHGDSLLMKEYSRYYTPAYIWNGWLYRQQCSMTGTISDDDKALFKLLPEYFERIIKAEGEVNNGPI